MLDSDPNNSGNRFLVFLLAAAFALAYVALNLATNSLPFGSDVSAIFPRWMTIRRGQVIAAVLGVAIVPWKILNSAKAFVTFLSGYGYFLAAIAAVLSTDYFIIKKGNLKVRDLWVGDSSSRFWFYRGVNYRALFATFVGLVPCLPSFIATLQPNIGISLGGQRMFYISFTLTYFIGGILYYLSYLVFPEKGLAIKERELKFEQWADEMDEAERRNLAAMAAEASAEEGEVDDKNDAAKDVETSNAKVYVLSNQ
jgi:NCS1 family nucleobase:cation symporter-1